MKSLLAISFVIFNLISFTNNNFYYSRNNVLPQSFAYNPQYAPVYRNEESLYNFSKSLLDVGVYPTAPATGKNIKIGILENYYINNVNESEFSNRNITFHNEKNSYEYVPYVEDDVTQNEADHAFQVAEIAAGNNSIASDSILFSSSIADHPTNAPLDWLIDNKVDVVNRSGNYYTAGGNLHYKDTPDGIYKYPSGIYTLNSKYLDEVIYENNLPFVISAGNYEKNVFEHIGDGPMALNAISVAAINKNLEVDSFVNVKGVEEEYEGMFVKPTLLAPGADIYDIPGVNYRLNFDDGGSSTISGTSYAAPYVTGIIALLMEEYPMLKGHPEMVMALLCNTATKANGQTEFVDDVNGFGIVDYAEARSAANNTKTIVIGNNAISNSLLYEEIVDIGSNETLDATSFTLYNPESAEFYDADDIDSKYIIPSTINFSKIKIKVIDLTTNVAVYSDSISNFSYINVKNTFYPHSYKIQIYLDGEHIESEETIVGFNYNIRKFTDESLNIIDGYYLDENPTFAYNATDYTKENSNYNVNINFVGENRNLLFRRQNLPKLGEITLTNDEWNDITSLLGKEYYAYIDATIDNKLYQSDIFIFNEPEDFNNLIQIKPHEFEFEQQYFYEVKVEEPLVKNDFSITSKRLRCGYIENTYVVLSPRRENAGEAYLELTFNKPIYGFMIGVTLWADDEELDTPNSTADIEYLDNAGNWNNELDLLNDIALAQNRMDIYRYSMKYNEPIYGLRIIARSDAIGDKNKGRICIDDIVFLLDEDDNFVITNYDSIVQDDEYYFLRSFY